MNFLKEGREKFSEYSEKGKARANKLDGRLGNVKKGKLSAPAEEESNPVLARPLNSLKDPKLFPPPPVHRVAHGEVGQSPVAQSPVTQQAPAPAAVVSTPVPQAYPTQAYPTQTYAPAGQPEGQPTYQPAYQQPGQPPYQQPGQPPYQQAGQPPYQQAYQPAVQTPQYAQNPQEALPPAAPVAAPGEYFVQTPAQYPPAQTQTAVTPVSPPGYSSLPPVRTPMAPQAASSPAAVGLEAPAAPVGANRAPPPPPPARNSPAPVTAQAPMAPSNAYAPSPVPDSATAAAAAAPPSEEYEEKPKKIMFPLVDPSSFPAPPQFLARPVVEEPPKKSAYSRTKAKPMPSAPTVSSTGGGLQTDAARPKADPEQARSPQPSTPQLDPRSFAPPPVYGGSSNRNTPQAQPTVDDAPARKFASRTPSEYTATNTEPVEDVGIARPPRPSAQLGPEPSSSELEQVTSTLRKTSLGSAPNPNPRPPARLVPEPSSSELEHVTSNLRKTSFGSAPSFASEIASRKANALHGTEAASVTGASTGVSRDSTGGNSDIDSLLAKKKKPPPPPKKKPGLVSKVSTSSSQGVGDRDDDVPPPMAPRPPQATQLHETRHAALSPPVPAPRASPKPIIAPKPVRPGDVDVSAVIESEKPPPMAPRPPPINMSTRPPALDSSASGTGSRPGITTQADFNFELASRWYMSMNPKLPQCFEGMPYTYSSSSIGYKHQLKLAIRNPQDLSIIRAQITWETYDPKGTVEVKRYDIPAPRLPSKDVLEQYSELFGDDVAHWCENKVGMQVGNGECWTLAKEAIERGTGGKAMAPVGYNFGVVILRLGGPVTLAQRDSVRRGDVIQFTSVKMSNARGSKTYGAPNHTAVVVEVISPTKFTIVHQNIGGVKRVSLGELDLADFVQGEMEIYRVVPQTWAGELKV